MASMIKPTYDFTGGQHGRQKATSIATGVDFRVQDNEPILPPPPGLTPLQESLHFKHSPRFGHSLAPVAYPSTRRQAQKPAMPDQLSIPPFYTNPYSSDTDTSFQVQCMDSDPHGYTSALTSTTYSDLNHSDIEENCVTHVRARMHGSPSVDLSPELDIESRRLEAVWRETGKRWKEKHGTTLPRSQHPAFRWRIESGENTKTESPIDKEWRDMWMQTNSSWSDAESTCFKSPDVYGATTPNGKIRNPCPPSVDAHVTSQTDHNIGPIAGKAPALEHKPATFHRIKTLIDDREDNESLAATSALSCGPTEPGYKRKQAGKMELQVKNVLKLETKPHVSHKQAENEGTSFQAIATQNRSLRTKQHIHKLIIQPGPNNFRSIIPVPTPPPTRKRHHVDKQKLREKQRAEEARRFAAAEHRDYEDGVHKRRSHTRENQDQNRCRTNDSSHTEVPSRQSSGEASSLRSWNLYQTNWSALSASDVNGTQSLRFRDIPWPLLRTPISPKSITPQSVGAFILSPLHSKDQTREERIKNALLHWEPNTFEKRWMARIKEGEWVKVKEAVGEVYTCLFQLMGEVSASNKDIESVSTSSPQEPEGGMVTIGKRMSVHDIVECLVQCGCQDMTDRLDLNTFNECPTSHGGFSDVYHGRLLAGRHVAVKALRISTGNIGNPKHLKRAARELYTWSNCKHPNVLQLLGLAVFRGRIGMVSPWIDHGALPQYLDNNTQMERCTLCAQICGGLSYLHSIDIANVLVLANGTPVVTDFGNSTFLSRGLLFTETTREGGLTSRWAAPELLEGSGKPSRAADVYALGMTMLEVITGKPPYDGSGDLAVLKLVIDKKLPERPIEHIPTESRDGNRLWRLLEKCWAYEPKQRPSAIQVTEVMRSITAQGLKAIGSH